MPEVAEQQAGTEEVSNEPQVEAETTEQEGTPDDPMVLIKSLQKEIEGIKKSTSKFQSEKDQAVRDKIRLERENAMLKQSFEGITQGLDLDEPTRVSLENRMLKQQLQQYAQQDQLSKQEQAFRESCMADEEGLDLSLIDWADNLGGDYTARNKIIQKSIRKQLLARVQTRSKAEKANEEAQRFNERKAQGLDTPETEVGGVNSKRFTRAQIEKMTPEEYQKARDAILEAARQGTIK